MKKRLFFTAALLLNALGAFAQGNGVGGINEATGMVSSYFDPATKLIYPIAFNPFYTEDGVFDIEKKESIKTLILTLWKREDEPPTRAEEVALSNAVNLFLEKIRGGSVAGSGATEPGASGPTFNTF